MPSFPKPEKLSRRVRKLRKTLRKKRDALPAKYQERVVEAVKVFRDGREVCGKTPEGRAEYLKRTLVMAERQNWLCIICGLLMTVDDVTFEHTFGRGSGGGHRDDRIENNAAAHSWCNSAKGSRRGYANRN